ncbi:BQ2448_2121 [Microbotryum intermedium]|uniref:BQ2448_2121 protein n=1 Tax=Microbotryum intermedium TaxID=269621 RepID=A0A238FAI8_9BASI|nr:BQ2448_2121 [Microbotryum intermedium]
MFVHGVYNENTGLGYLKTVFTGLIAPTVSLVLGIGPLQISEKPSTRELGQQGDGTYELRATSDVPGTLGPILTLLPVEAKTGENFKRLFHAEREIKNRKWQPMQSPFLDIRILKHEAYAGEPIMTQLEDPAAMCAKIALQMLSVQARFGLFYAAPYNVIVELVVEEGRTFLLIGDFLDFTDATSAPTSPTFHAHLMPLFLQSDSAYRTEEPSMDLRRELRAVATEVEVYNRGGPSALIVLPKNEV